MSDDKPGRTGPEDVLIGILFAACMFGLAAWILVTGAGG